MSLARFFAEKIINIILEEPLLKDCVIVAVPPRPGKIKHTGWDQVEYLLKCIKRISKKNKISITVKKCLKRKKSMIQKSVNTNATLFPLPTGMSRLMQKFGEQPGLKSPTDI